MGRVIQIQTCVLTPIIRMQSGVGRLSRISAVGSVLTELVKDLMFQHQLSSGTTTLG
jgi:hypothetical protein